MITRIYKLIELPDKIPLKVDQFYDVGKNNFKLKRKKIIKQKLLTTKKNNIMIRIIKNKIFNKIKQDFCVKNSFIFISILASLLIAVPISIWLINSKAK